MKLNALMFLLAMTTALPVRAAAAPAALTFEAKEKKDAVTIKVGQELKIILPTTEAGYVWEVASNDIRFLKQAGRTVALPGGPTAGAAATFLGVKPGRSRLSFAYVQPNDTGETITADNREIAVTVR